jgi:selenocysteine lyase/cysteine desulfurase
VALSFYKLFGYPTGIGCLLARHDALARISLRTGCFCNPGAREAALGFRAAELAPLFRRAHLTADEQRELLRGRPIGAVRVSVGIVTTPDDVARLVELLRGFADRPDGRWPARLRRSLRTARRAPAAAPGSPARGNQAEDGLRPP